MGRPPLGKRAMTGSERQRRYWERKLLGKVKEGRAEERVGERLPRRAPRHDAPELMRLRSENAQMRAMMREDHDASALRKKVVELQANVAAMRRVMKEIAKERDEYRKKYERRAQPKFHAAMSLLTRQSYGIIIKALHSDRTHQVTTAERTEAERAFIAFRPLFSAG